MNKFINNFTLKLNRHFRDREWAESIGDLQKSFEDATDGVSLDLTNLRWIDPLPMMSLLIEMENLLSRGLNVKLSLPVFNSVDNEIDSLYHESPNKLLRFFHLEGFFSCIDKLKNNYGKFKVEGYFDREVYENLDVKASYEDSKYIPVELIEVPLLNQELSDNSEKFALNVVANVFANIDNRLDAKIPPATQEQLIYKLRVAIQEFAHNAQEHAYSANSSYKSIAIYVRYRTGGLELDKASSITFERCIKQERAECPSLDNDWLMARAGCLEVFFLDRGVGYVNSFAKAGVEIPGKYKFNEVMKSVFLDGKSTKPERKTKFGGLHLLYNLLAKTGDYIRGLDDSTWFGTGTPIIRQEKGVHKLVDQKKPMVGLATHIRLGWKVQADRGDKWAKFKNDHESEIWDELKISLNQNRGSFASLSKKIVIDERFYSSNNEQLDDPYIDGDKSDWVLWLVRSHRMKWDILTFMERVIAPKISSKAVLVIADIPSHEAETYAAALAEFEERANVHWPSLFSKIILVTDRWRFALVQYEKKSDKRHGFSGLLTEFPKINIGSLDLFPAPPSIRLAIVRWIKWHDSRRLWEEISDKKTKRHIFVNESIIWGSDENSVEIDGYLNFHETTRNGLCGEIYRRSLARILGVLSENGIQLKPLDSLTANVVRDIYATEFYEFSKRNSEQTLVLGSVLVSGDTLISSHSSSLDLHFLIHVSSPLDGNKASLLYWLPDKSKSTSHKTYSRIGKTSAIAVDGWKSFEIPRFSLSDEESCIGGRLPEDTYKDWQKISPVIVKSGHWVYQGHHDFLTINIESAVDSDFLEKGDLAKYILRKILPFIGLGHESLNNSWKRIFPELIPNENPGLLVYRSHPVSESIVRRIFEALTDSGKTEAFNRVFPVLPIRSRWSGSTFLIPPMILQSIKDEIHSGKLDAKPVMIFDDATITGRTIFDLRSSVSSLGAKQITTFVIANRLRQPSDSIDATKIEYYWRFDIPEMGRDGSCPLCHSIQLAESFSNNLNLNSAKDVIGSWVRKWSECSPIENWSAGLKPIPLGATHEQEKKYCHRIGAKKEYLSKIMLTRSTGLSIHASELHAMTGRDDYFLKKIAEYNEPEVKIELACCQLFLFGNEFDQNIKIKLCRVLLSEIQNIGESSPHFSLAVLSIIAAIQIIDKDIRFKVIEGVFNYPVGGKKLNYSTHVLLAYLIHEKLIDSDHSVYEFGSKILPASSLTFFERLRHLYLESLSPKGNAHCRPLPLLFDTVRTDGDVLSEMLIKAIDSVERFSDLIDGLGYWNVRLGKSEYEGFIFSFNEASKVLMSNLNLARLESFDRSKAKQDLEKYFYALYQVMGCYFYRIDNVSDLSQDNNFGSYLKESVINDIDWAICFKGKNVGSRDVNVGISSSFFSRLEVHTYEICIPWYRELINVVTDLIKNAIYASKRISDPWLNGIRTAECDMWIQVQYGPRAVVLVLANAFNESQDLIRDRIKNRWSDIRALGGDVDFQFSNGNIYTNIYIPYAGYIEGKVQ